MGTAREDGGQPRSAPPGSPRPRGRVSLAHTLAGTKQPQPGHGTHTGSKDHPGIATRRYRFSLGSEASSATAHR